ncbi:hypothetical protein G9464_20705 [Halostella sp. JP-L12]|uniref:hypothetical protein n=1 Tax=Halostella TaxID=1843185 RepID=UPI000EF7C1D5|nr:MULTISPECIES: hypothetical protein [Halostella]NHN49993.1 hypothetical protein [Halostella sp. JP-L12]
MKAYTTPSKKSDGSTANLSSSCDTCGADARRFGRNGRIDVECPNCGVIDTTADKQIVADGGVPQSVSILEHIRDTGGRSDTLQRFAAGELVRDELTTRDVTRPVELAMGDLCITVEYPGKTEYVWPTEVGWVAHTVHHDRQTDWGPIPLSLDEVERRVHSLGHTLTIRATSTVSFDRPDAALSQGVRA